VPYITTARTAPQLRCDRFPACPRAARRSDQGPRIRVIILGDTAVVNRVVLRRRGEAVVEAREVADHGTVVAVTRLAADELAGFVRAR
jgi:hypothetical protein